MFCKEKGNHMIFNPPSVVTSLWVVEWSPQQEQFHIEPVNEMLETNSRIFEKKTKADYFPIAICPTENDAQTVCKQAEQTLQRKTP